MAATRTLVPYTTHTGTLDISRVKACSDRPALLLLGAEENIQ